MIQVGPLTSPCGGKAFGVRLTSMLLALHCVGETSEPPFSYLQNRDTNTLELLLSSKCCKICKKP